MTWNLFGCPGSPELVNANVSVYWTGNSDFILGLAGIIFVGLILGFLSWRLTK